VGSILFTSAAYLQYVECINADRRALPAVGRRRRLLAIEVRRIDWWATAVQLLGTLFFDMTTFTALDAHHSAIAGWVQPTTGDLLDAALDTSGTFWGAVCFFAGAALLLRAEDTSDVGYASSAASMS
jgi:hypothetical protein